jgi:lipopolysaccharide biosynthesis protein
MKIAVCVHLFYPDMFNDIVNYLNNLKHPYKLYITLVNGYYTNDIIEKIKKYKSDEVILFVENKGVDIGGFLNCLKVIDNDTDLVLKIHTKKGIGLPNSPSLRVKRSGIDVSISHGRQWFHGLMKGVLMDEDKVNRILNKFKIDNNCGMVGYKLYNNSSVNKNNIVKLLPLFGLDSTYLDKNFIGGTIFWVRYGIIKKYFTENVINQIMNNTQPGYIIEPSTMHAVERILGYIVAKENKNVITVD